MRVCFFGRQGTYVQQVEPFRPLVGAQPSTARATAGSVYHDHSPYPASPYVGGQSSPYVGGQPSPYVSGARSHPASPYVGAPRLYQPAQREGQRQAEPGHRHSVSSSYTASPYIGTRSHPASPYVGAPRSYQPAQRQPEAEPEEREHRHHHHEHHDEHHQHHREGSRGRDVLITVGYASQMDNQDDRPHHHRSSRRHSQPPAPHRNSSSSRHQRSSSAQRPGEFNVRYRCV